MDLTGAADLAAAFLRLLGSNSGEGIGMNSAFGFSGAPEDSSGVLIFGGTF